MRRTLTTAFVDSAKSIHGAKRTVYWDDKLKGFGLRVSPGGSKTWVIIYRHNDRLRWFKLGTNPPLALAAARELAKQKLAQVQLGVDVAEAKKQSRAGDTFAALAQRYLDEHAKPKKKASSVREDEKILNRDVLPAWKTRKAADIAKADVIALIDGIASRGAPIGANRTLALVHKIFDFAVSKEIIAVNPAYRVPKPAKERAGERVLSDHEIRTLWSALDGFRSAKIADAYRLMLLTAQRVGEVTRMAWSEVDFDSGWWIIPPERSKTHQAHRVPLTPSALAVLQHRKAEAPKSPFVFPGGRKDQPLCYLGKRHALIKKACGFDFEPRDLRRTAGTWVASTGVGRFVVARLLGHADHAITSVYDKYGYDKEKRAALIKWDRRLQEIVTGKKASAKVVTLAG